MNKSVKTIDSKYKKLLRKILNKGSIKKDRTGTGTISIFGYNMEHDMNSGFPVLTTKKVYWKGVVGELLWFLKGDTNIKYLVDNNINIWNGDAYKNYTNYFNSTKNSNQLSIWEGNDKTMLTQEEFVDKIKTDSNFSNKFGDMGPIYGYQWRNPDQISNLIKELKNNPDSRRLLVDSWNPSQLKDMVLPPCHYSFQCNTKVLKNGKRELSLLFNMRSWDVFLGGPFNLASYGLLLEILCRIVDMVPGKLVVSSGDTHLYLNHREAVKEFLLTEESDTKPYIDFSDTVDFSNGIDGFLNTCKIEDIKLKNYYPTKVIKAPLSN